MDTKDEIGLRRKSIRIIYQCFLIYSCLFCAQNPDLTFYYSHSKYTVVCWFQGIFTTIQFQTRSDVTDARDAENQLDHCQLHVCCQGSKRHAALPGRQATVNYACSQLTPHTVITLLPTPFKIFQPGHSTTQILPLAENNLTASRKKFSYRSKILSH